jgi:hypothetical protein
LILGRDRKADTNYLETCRTKRNTVEFDHSGGATNADADEPIEFAEHLEKDVMEWLHSRHPDLMLSSNRL